MLLWVVPQVGWAACEGLCSFADLVSFAVGILGSVVPVMFGLVLVILIWKVADTWILNAADSQKRESGRQFVIAGILALVVMSSLWGIVALVKTALVGG